MKKSKLLIESTYDFDLLGLVAPLKDYKMAWMINNCLGLELKKSADYTMEFTNQPTLIISQYLLEKDFGFIQLLRNKSYPLAGQARFLVPELKIMDYFLLFQDKADGLDLNMYIERLSKLRGVQNVVKLDITKLKSRDNLLTY
ncbi:MAG: IPExxxVDY family protein [Lunatimonas sp.]|uniref:IPExxxVDY family protein n=1 Tax=Lunatimonas sp. TaxID=2060141 RepID=UPI00263A4663|nr:IPExxxVDY family protein [Lunatimonas sp.]MCC5936265.1 IPExxxVDY family protein [Lunatimonas sp.]